jgi:hypothetical protein
VRDVRALLLTIPPLVADLISRVVGPRLARFDVRLIVVTGPDPPADVVIATEDTGLPADTAAVVLSSDLTLILGGDEPVPLTAASLAQRLLEIIQQQPS